MVQSFLHTINHLLVHSIAMVMTRSSKRKVEEDEEEQEQGEEALYLTLPGFPSNHNQQHVSGSSVSKRIRRCEKLADVVLKVAPELIHYTRKSKRKTSSPWLMTAFEPDKPVIEDFPEQLIPQLKACSLSAAGRWPFRRAKRVPCSRDKSTAATCTVKKEIHGGQKAGGIQLGTQPYEGLHRVETKLNDGAESIHLVSPSVLPIQAVCDKQLETCTVKQEYHDHLVADGNHARITSTEGFRDVEIQVSGGTKCSQLLSPTYLPLQVVNHKLVSKDYLTAQLTDANEHKSLKDAIMTSNIVENRPNSPSEADSNALQATSLNLSDMALLDDDCSSANSEISDPLVTVGNYRVRHDLTPIFRDIFSKYGDIAAQCCKKSDVMRSLLLENVCDIVQNLQAKEFVYLTPIEVNRFRVLVEDIKSDDVEVRWLHQRLDEILEAKKLLKESPQVKQAKRHIHHEAEKKEEEIKAYEEEMRKLQEKIGFAKDELEARKAEEIKFGEILFNTKLKVKRFHCNSMIDGLL